MKKKNARTEKKWSEYFSFHKIVVYLHSIFRLNLKNGADCSLKERVQKIFWKKFPKNLEVKKNVVPLHSEMVNADVAQLARAADL